MTNKGKVIYNKILSGFLSTPFNKSERSLIITELTIKERLPSIIGAIITDKDGMKIFNKT